MDPISALGIAAAGVQFVDFTTRVLSGTFEMYKSASGQTQRISSLSEITTELASLTKWVEETASKLPQGAPPGSPDAILITACQQCQEISQDLTAVLQPLSAQISSKLKLKSVRSSVAAALRSAMAESKLKALTGQLEEIQQRMRLAALLSLWEKARREDTPFTQASQQQLDVMATLAQPDATTTVTATYLRDVAAGGSDPGHSNSRRQLIQAMWATAWLPGVAPDPDLDSAELAHLQTQHSLVFDSLSDRQEAIPQAYANTFSWMFKPQDDADVAVTASKPGFTSWLEANAREIYWIAGKPGSGKSTLIKYLAAHPKLKEHLSVWAGDAPLIVASFYSWNAGTELQRSIEGLLRTLLFQCLRQRPDLTARVCRRRWACLQMLGLETAGMLPDWRWDELVEAFKLLASEAGDGYRLFLLIDGLDEFSGGYTKLLELLKDLGQFEGVKICVSSRPWTVFNDAFQHSPSLRVQDLTENDIVHYVNGHFEALPAFQELRSLQPNEAASLLDNIASRADGVFLWVSVVVGMITTRMAEGARLADMRALVNQLSRDVEHLFDAIRGQISAEHTARSSQYFLLLLESRRKPRPLPLSASTFLLADEDEGSSFHHDFSSTVDAVPTVQRRLHSRTMGLLEISQSGTVQFLHRTVFEWATKPENLAALMRDSQPPFNPNLELLKARKTELINFKFQPGEDSEDLQPRGGGSKAQFWRLLGACLRHAAWAKACLQHQNYAWFGSATVFHHRVRLHRALEQLDSHIHGMVEAKTLLLGGGEGTDGLEHSRYPIAYLAARFAIPQYVMAIEPTGGLYVTLLRQAIYGHLKTPPERLTAGESPEMLRELSGEMVPGLYQTRLELVKRILDAMPGDEETRKTLAGQLEEDVRVDEFSVMQAFRNPAIGKLAVVHPASLVTDILDSAAGQTDFLHNARDLLLEGTGAPTWRRIFRVKGVQARQRHRIFSYRSMRKRNL